MSTNDKFNLALITAVHSSNEVWQIGAKFVTH